MTLTNPHREQSQAMDILKVFSFRSIMIQYYMLFFFLMFIVNNIYLYIEDGDTSNILREVELPISSAEDCNAQSDYSKINITITSNQICAGVPEGMYVIGYIGIYFSNITLIYIENIIVRGQRFVSGR